MIQSRLMVRYFVTKMFFVSVVIIAVLLGSSADSYATHGRFAHITWRQLGGNDIEFTFHAAFRRDGYDGSGTDGLPITGDVIEETIGDTTLNFGDGEETGTLFFTVTSFDVTNNWILGVGGVNSGDTTIVHTYPGPGDYLAFSESCCRISDCDTPNAHINNPDGDYRFEVLVNVGTGNNSPVASLPPIVVCPQGGICSFTIPASDPDGDTLSFALSTAEEASGSVDGFVQPGPPDAPNTASIDPVTGVFTWDTTGATLGEDICGTGFNTLYSAQVKIEDGTSKVILDFLIQLLPCPTGNNAPVFDSPPTPACGSTINVAPGNPVTFTVQASDPDGDTVTLNVAGLPAGATMIPPLPLTGTEPTLPTTANATILITNGTPVSSDFSWTPTINDAGTHVLSFTAADECGAQTLCSITIQVSQQQEICDNCIDDDDDTLIDLMDPDCASLPLGIKRGILSFRRGVLRIKGNLPQEIGLGDIDPTSEDVSLTMIDGDGAFLCITIPAGNFVANKKGNKFKFKDKTGNIAGGIRVMKIWFSRRRKEFRFKIRGKGLDLSGANHPDIATSLYIGNDAFIGFGQWGKKKKIKL